MVQSYCLTNVTHNVLLVIKLYNLLLINELCKYFIIYQLSSDLYQIQIPIDKM
jgi:hypothetical protein